MKDRPEEFRKYAHQFVDWMADYMQNVTDYPVKSLVKPGEIFDQIENEIPVEGEALDHIFEDFKKIILPGITHWQSPNFYAYFPANSSPPSVLAEMLTATLGVQGMKWDTAPASTELEEKMMVWLREAMGIPSSWSGVIQDSASGATLTSIITAREQKSDYGINTQGFAGFTNYRVYCSEETHSSIEKGTKIAGIGKNNLVKITTDNKLALQPEVLRDKIKEDISNGLQPLCIVAAIGTTGTLAVDPLKQIAAIAKEFNIWLHVDAAYSGSALLLPEYRKWIEGIDIADSLVFNAHKWLFTNFDCSVYFVKNKEALTNTFSILPEYLKSKTDGLVNNHSDWGIPLGRRFRSLKLWFVLRYYGLAGLQEKLRFHINLAASLEEKIKNHPNFRLIVPRTLNLVCFRYEPGQNQTNAALNQLNERLLNQLNKTGKVYLTHTRVNNNYTLRMAIGQTNVKAEHVEAAWMLINSMAQSLNPTLEKPDFSSNNS